MANAGEEGTTDPLQLAKDVGGGALVGGLLGAGAPLLTKKIGGKNRAAKIRGAANENAAEVVSSATENTANNAIQGQPQPNQAPNLTPYARLKAGQVIDYEGQKLQVLKNTRSVSGDNYTSVKTPDGKVLDINQKVLDPKNGLNLDGSRRIAQDVGQDVLPSQKTFDPSSRAKQYDESLQKTIQNIEKDPTYLEDLKARGGGTVISNKETYAKARALGPMTEDEIINAKPAQKIDAVTVVRAKATLDSALKEFTDFWESKKWTPEELQSQIERVSKLESGYHVISAEPGRALQAQSTFIAEATKKAEKLQKLLKETKGPNRNKLIDKELGEFDEQMAKAAESGTFEPSTLRKFQDALAEYATAAKLTSPLTHAINITSSLLNLGQRGAEKAITTTWAAAKGETSLKEVKYIFGTSQGLRNAASQFARDIKQSLDVKAPDLTQNGVKSEQFKSAIPGKVGKAIRTPFNLLTAGDNFFKTILRDSELHSQAYGKAYQEGFRGNELTKRVSELISAPTDEMLAKAESVAKEYTFTNDPGPISAGISRILGNVPLLRLLVPFVQTPTNLAVYQARRSALGIFSPRNISDIAKGGIPRREAVARLTVGAGLSLGAITSVMNLGDNITGAAPTDKGAKDLFYASGKKPYAIKVGNRWVQYNRFQPIGLYLTQAVGVRDALVSKDSKTAGNLFTSLVATTAKGLADLPFVSGVSGVIEALNDPSDESAITKAIGNPITGLIPNISRDIATGKDPIAREPKSISDQIKMMVPGLREQVKPRVDVTGRVQNSFDTSFVERGLIKITSKEKEDKLYKALDEIGKQTDYYPQPPKPTTQVRGRILSTDEFTRYSAASGYKFGSKLEQAINDAEFKQLSPDEKQRTVQNMLTDAREEAANEMFGAREKKTQGKKLKRY